MMTWADWLFLIGWWLAGAPALTIGILWISVKLADKVNNHKDKKGE